MIGKAWRERFEADPEQLMTTAGLNDREKHLVRERDWLGLIQYGASSSCWRSSRGCRRRPTTWRSTRRFEEKASKTS